MADGHDHDLMVELNIKVTQLCRTTEKYYKENNAVHNKMIEKMDRDQEIAGMWIKEVHDRIDKQAQCSMTRLDSCHKTFLQSRIFYWILAFVIVGLVSLAGELVIQRTQSQTNKKTIDYHIENMQTTIEEKN